MLTRSSPVHQGVTVVFRPPTQAPKSSSRLGEGTLQPKDLLVHRAIVNAEIQVPESLK